MRERKVVTITGISTSTTAVTKKLVVWLHMNRGDFYIRDALVIGEPKAFWRIVQVHSSLHPSLPILHLQDSTLIDFNEFVGRKTRIVFKDTSRFGPIVTNYEKPHTRLPASARI